MSRDTLNHNHGDAGSKPVDGEDFQSGQVADPQVFDWLFDAVPSAIDGHASEFTRLDGNNDGVVDKADYANDADASTYKGNDIDSNGDGKVDSAVSADDATNVTSTYKGNDIDSNSDGKVDSADSADNATNVTSTYKGNDIDPNGDGTVDSAENVTSTYKGNDIDADGDGVVDTADYANDADASTYKGNDIDSDGDGKVNSAVSADDATNVTSTYKGNDIDSDGDGTVNDAENVTSTYKGNDIDSDGDGTVDNADTVGGEPPSNFADATDGFVASTPTYEDTNRSIDTQYTNNTGGPIMVYIECGLYDSDEVNAKIDGKSIYGPTVSFADDADFVEITISMIVPDGSTYKLKDANGSPFIVSWNEQELTA